MCHFLNILEVSRQIAKQCSYLSFTCMQMALYIYVCGSYRKARIFGYLVPSWWNSLGRIRKHGIGGVASLELWV